MKIKELMSHPAVTCPASATLDQAARLMWEFDCGVVPVTDDKGHLTGILTDRDVCMAAYTQGRLLQDLPVTIAMARNVIAVHEDDAVETAEHLMADNQIRRLPVLDYNGHVLGVVSLNDISRLAQSAKRSVVDRELVSTIAAVSQPRTSMAVEHGKEQLTATAH